MKAPVDQFLLDCAAAATEVPLPRYMDWAFGALAQLLRFDSAGWGIGTHDPPVTHAIYLRGVPPEVMLAYEAGVAEVDFIRAAAAAAPGTTINDFDIRDAHPEASAALDDRISTPFGLEQTLATSLPLGGTSRLQHLLLLWRARRFDPFNEAERRLVERCVPHMVAGLRTAQALHLARAGRVREEGHALVDDKGLLHSFDDAFVRLVRGAFPGWGGPGLPAALMPALAGGAVPPGLALQVAPDGPWLRLAVTRRTTLPLTPAQLQAARLYAEGLDHRAIAARLGLSPATVRNHLAAAYRRLGVNDKAALARRLAG
jgi:DNA-binding CsgD family transcriptional regulator